MTPAPDRQTDCLDALERLEDACDCLQAVADLMGPCRDLGHVGGDKAGMLLGLIDDRFRDCLAQLRGIVAGR